MVNPDTSMEVYFGPTPLWQGEEHALRLYGPLQPWFDKTWKPGEIEKVN